MKFSAAIVCLFGGLAGISALSSLERTFPNDFEMSARSWGSVGPLPDLFLRRADYVVQSCCEHSFVTGKVPDGRTAMWFEIDRSDALVKGSHRSELRFLSDRFGTPRHYEAEIFVPDTWQRDGKPVLAMQWHASRDRILFERGRVPPLEIAIEGDEWVVRHAADINLRSSHKAVQTVLARTPMTPGDTALWSVDAIWSPRWDGRVSVKLNGAEIARYRGPTAHNDMIGPYFKLGVYSPKLSTSPESPDRRRLAVIAASTGPGHFD